MAYETTVPQGVDEITPPWVESVLQRDLPGCRVASIDITRIGEGVGFLGELARISIEYGSDPSNAPSSIIAKIATQVAEPRALAVGMGFYEREVSFYRDLAHQAGARVPHSYYSRLQPDGGFALVLEDFPDAIVGDQIKSCTDDEACLAVREIAKLHAQWWQSDKLAQYEWFPTQGHPFLDTLRETYRQCLPVYEERCGEKFGPDVLRLANRLADRYDEYISYVYENLPLTLVHGDYRLDNLLFNAEEKNSPLVVLDWQLTQQTSGLADLQYFIAGNLRNDARRRLTDDLLRLYYDTLCEAGVRDYGLAQCREDFRAMSTLLAFYLVVGTASINPEDYDERGHDLIELLYGSMAEAILEHDAEGWMLQALK